MRTFIVGFTLLFAGLTSQPGHTQTSRVQKSMKGLTGVVLLVEPLDIGARKIDLTLRDIQADIELKLRLAGMHILTEEQGNTPGVALLYANVNITDDASAANVALYLEQDVLLYTDPNVFIGTAKTWGSEEIVARPTRSGIRNPIKDHADRFLNAWLAANPKTP